MKWAAGFRTILNTAIAMLLIACSMQADDGRLPRDIKLTGPEARQTLLVEMADGALVTESVRECGIHWSSADEQRGQSR